MMTEPSSSYSAFSSSGSRKLATTSSSLFLSSAASAASDAASPQDKAAANNNIRDRPFPRHPNDDRLYLIPKELRPTYGNLPWLVNTSVWMISMVTSALWTWKTLSLQKLATLTWVQPLVAMVKHGAAVPNISRLIGFLVKVRINFKEPVFGIV